MFCPGYSISDDEKEHFSIVGMVRLIRYVAVRA
jgi:hypothetical protein